MSIPDTVRQREWPATGKWEAVQVFDSNWEKAIPGVVDPEGKLSHVYDGFAPYWVAVDYADHLNNEG